MKMRILSAWKVLKAIEKIDVLYLIVMLHKQHALTIQMKITSTENFQFRLVLSYIETVSIMYDCIQQRNPKQV